MSNLIINISSEALNYFFIIIINIIRPIVLTAFVCILNGMSLTAWERTLSRTERCVVEHSPSAARWR